MKTLLRQMSILLMALACLAVAGALCEGAIGLWAGLGLELALAAGIDLTYNAMVTAQRAAARRRARFARAVASRRQLQVTGAGPVRPAAGSAGRKTPDLRVA